MHLLYVGLTHKQAPITVIEKVHFKEEDLLFALRRLKDEKSILENVIVSTCNRTELYLIVDQLHTGRYYAKHFLADWFEVDIKELEPFLVFKEGDNVLRHLFRVSIGLESKILGENQILGQLKRAFVKAQSQNTMGIIFKEVSRRTLTFAKKMHEKYRINDRPVSISLTAMEMLKNDNFEASGKSIAIVGLGEIGILVTKYALAMDFKTIHLINRTTSKAAPFLHDNRVRVHEWKDLSSIVSQADVVFTAVKTDGFIIYPEMLKSDSYAFDLCLPRAIHPDSSIKLYNIENLTRQLDSYQHQRERIAESISLEVENEIFSFDEWRRQLGIVPLIKAIRERGLRIQEAAMDSIDRKMPYLSERERKQISKHMKGIVNQIIKEPILQLKEMSVGENSEYDISLICKLFALQQGEENKNDTNKGRNEKKQISDDSDSICYRKTTSISS